MRLIDADKLKVEVKKALLFSGDFMAQASVAKVIDAAPTVDLWHYPSKGKYPKEGEEVLFRCDGQNYLGTYSDTSHYFDSRDMGSPADYVECWQYIVPPKEEE